MMQVVIIAGGMGTRLREVTGEDVPKPLVKVNGRPLLDYQLSNVSQAGGRDVLLLTGYGGEKINEFCGDGSKWGLSIRCVKEQSPAGTAGAVLQALQYLEHRFMVLYGDTVFDFDMARMIAFHERSSADATLFLHPNDHPHDSDLVEVNSDNLVLKFHPYPHPPDANLPNLVNAAIYIIERSVLSTLDVLPPKPDFGKHVFPLLLACRRRLMGYRSPEYVKDAGTPERLVKVTRDLLSGRVTGCSLRKTTSAVFLDRDGTLIEERGYIKRPEDVALLPGVGSALAELNASICRTVLVTNQPVIARGECDERGLRQIHNRLETLLGEKGAYLDALYYCPHHPDSGFPGERIELKIACECRKPNIGLIRQAEQDLNLNLKDSWMVGDTTTDMMTARRAGMRSILVRTGEAGRDGKWNCPADFECPSLVEASDLIVRRWPFLQASALKLAKNIESGTVVLIGGLAFSGKSSIAASLASVLRAQGRSAVVVQLDNWLLGERERNGLSVVDRYDLAAARAFLTDAVAGPGVKKVPRYDRFLRQSIPNGVEIEIHADPILIVEGVPALADLALLDMSSQRVYVERPEADRLKAMADNYRWRGWDEVRIAALLAERGTEEVPFISATSRFANVVLKGT
jgi:histidinol-phosphate phosphatase family protein